MSFNMSSRIVLHEDRSTHQFGVILPHSGKVLSDQDLDARISKTVGHLEYLANAQAHRNTHGGKRFRSRKVSNLSQRQQASERLQTLQKAKQMLADKQAGSSQSSGGLTGWLSSFWR